MMKIKNKIKATTTIIFFLSVICLWTGLRLWAQTGSPSPSPDPSLTKPKQQISYLRDGALWLMKEDGTENRQIVPAPEESSVANQIWAKDGKKIYFNIGLNVYAYVLQEQKIETLGALQLPEGISIDRVELGNDNKTLLFQTIDSSDVMSSVSRVYALSVTTPETRELSVDEYHALAPAQSTIVRNAGELSVSPDGRFVLFAEANEKDIQLFISDIETGNRHQITDLSSISDFEPAAMSDGGRRIIEATWSPDGHHVVFVPAQSCSEGGLCAGKMYLVDTWGGAQLQLALEMTANLAQEWNHEKNLLVYDDGGKILISDPLGQVKQLAEGNLPKWQPVV